MAEFCSQCADKYFEYPDIKLFKIALNLKKGRSVSFLCEGCNNRGIYKDEEGKLYLAKLIEKEIKLFPVSVSELVMVSES